MRYADQFKDQLDIDSKTCSLEKLYEKLGVVNSRAHRALSDAIATAGAYLKLKEMDSGTADVSVDDLLSDLDE